MHPARWKAGHRQRQVGRELVSFFVFIAHLVSSRKVEDSTSENLGQIFSSLVTTARPRQSVSNFLGKIWKSSCTIQYIKTQSILWQGHQSIINQSSINNQVIVYQSSTNLQSKINQSVIIKSIINHQSMRHQS